MGQQGEALLERILEAVPGGVVHVGADGAIHRANAAAQAFLGLSYDALTQRYTVDFAGATYFEDGRPCGVESYPVSRCLMTGEAQGPLTIGVVQPSGELRWAVFRAIPGPEASAVVSFLDITEHLEQRREQERLRAQLELAERLAAVGTLAAGVAHEINNPLTAVIGNIDLATLSLGPLESEVQGMLKRARSASLRVAEIVRSLRQFAREDAPEAQPFRVGEAVETAVSLGAPSVRSRARVVVKELDPTAWAVGHLGQAVQIVLNLMVNASQAYEVGSALDNTVTLRVWTERDRVLVEVADQGRGMSAEVLRRAREPFFTTKELGQGTGLGLAICHSLVDGMGGSLELRSEPGEGTTATVRLPAALGEGLKEESGERAESGLSGLNILVVDDEANIRELCVQFLGWKHTVVAASDGVQALTLLQKLSPDLVLCDLAMPHLGGAELYRRVQELKPALAQCFVFMTGAADLPGSRSFLEAHEGPVLLKPFSLSQLAEVLEEAHDALNSGSAGG